MFKIEISKKKNKAQNGILAGWQKFSSAGKIFFKRLKIFFAQFFFGKQRLKFQNDALENKKAALLFSKQNGRKIQKERCKMQTERRFFGFSLAVRSSCATFAQDL